MGFVCSICSEDLDTPSRIPNPSETSNLQVSRKLEPSGEVDPKNIVGILCGHVFHEVCLRAIFKDKNVGNCPDCTQECRLRIEMIKLYPNKQSTTSNSNSKQQLSPSNQQELKEVLEFNDILLKRVSTLQEKNKTELARKHELEMKLTSLQGNLDDMGKIYSQNIMAYQKKNKEIQELNSNLAEINGKYDLELKLKLNEFENLKSKHDDEIEEIHSSDLRNLQEIKIKHELELNKKLKDLEKSLNMKFKAKVKTYELSISNYVNKIFADVDCDNVEKKDNNNAMPLPSTSKGNANGLKLTLHHGAVLGTDDIDDDDEDDSDNESDSDNNTDSLSTATFLEGKRLSSQQVESFVPGQNFNYYLPKDASDLDTNSVIQLGEGITIDARKYRKCIRNNIRCIAKKLLDAVYPRNVLWWAKATFKQNKRHCDSNYIVPIHIINAIVDHLSTFGEPYRKPRETLNKFQSRIKMGLHGIQKSARRSKEYKRYQSRINKTKPSQGGSSGVLKKAGLGSALKGRRRGRKPKVAKNVHVVPQDIFSEPVVLDDDNSNSTDAGVQ